MIISKEYAHKIVYLVNTSTLEVSECLSTRVVIDNDEKVSSVQFGICTQYKCHEVKTDWGSFMFYNNCNTFAKELIMITPDPMEAYRYSEGLINYRTRCLKHCLYRVNKICQDLIAKDDGQKQTFYDIGLECVRHKNVCNLFMIDNDGIDGLPRFHHMPMYAARIEANDDYEEYGWLMNYRRYQVTFCEYRYPYGQYKLDGNASIASTKYNGHPYLFCVKPDDALKIYKELVETRKKQITLIIKSNAKICFNNEKTTQP